MPHYTLPKLTFEFADLEPVLSKEVVEIHYTKHHATYVANLNKALEQLEACQKTGDLTRQIALQSSIQFNGGGHINHSLYWENLCSTRQGGGILAKGVFQDKLIEEFGSFLTFQEKMIEKAAQIQGSGWAWLGYNKERNTLSIDETKNHKLLFAKKGLIPLLCIDTWEHAYYLQYKNAKASYLKELWSIINWNIVEARFKQATGSL